MPTLLEVQRAIGAFLAQGDLAAVEFVIADRIAPDARLNIYRNTYVGNLVGALRISYPAIRRLVGEDFFEGAARAFIDTYPPQSAYLNDYGSKLGDFLAHFPPAASLAYLPDVARLEWAVNCALHAEDAPTLDPACLAASPAAADSQFVAHPSVRLLQTDYPADSIWRATVDEDDDALAAIDVDEGPLFIIVSRGANGVSVGRVTADEFRFAEAIFTGVALSGALAAVDRDMSQSLAAHFTAGRFTGIHLEPPKAQEGTGL
jgi:hypothetical protein